MNAKLVYQCVIVLLIASIQYPDINASAGEHTMGMGELVYESVRVKISKNAGINLKPVLFLMLNIKVEMPQLPFHVTIRSRNDSNNMVRRGVTRTLWLGV